MGAIETPGVGDTREAGLLMVCLTDVETSRTEVKDVDQPSLVLL